MEVSVDIEEVQKFVMSDEFRNFLLDNTSDFGVAAFILQTLLESIDKAKENIKETK